MADEQFDTSGFGQRLSVVEDDLNELKVTAASSSTKIDAIGADMGIMFKKMDRIAESSGSNAATKGMIPVSYVTWAVTTLMALVALGITMLTVAGGVMIYAMASGDEKDQLMITANTHEIEDGDSHRKDIDEWKQFHEMEMSRMSATQNANIKENQAELTEFKDWYHGFLEDYGKLTGKVDSLWSEIADLKNKSP